MKFLFFFFGGRPPAARLAATPVNEVKPGDFAVWAKAQLSELDVRVLHGVRELVSDDGPQGLFRLIREQKQRALVNVGEKNRLVVFEFATAVTEVPIVESGSRFPLVSVVLSTVALAGVTTFAVLGLSGRMQLDALLKQECASTKSCAPSTVAEVQRRFLIADVALGAGVVAAGFATWQWISWATAPVTVAFDGRSVSLSGVF